MGTLVPTPTQGLGPVTPRLGVGSEQHLGAPLLTSSPGGQQRSHLGRVRGPAARPLLPGLALPGACAVQHAGPPTFAASTSSPGPGPWHLTWERRGTEEPTSQGSCQGWGGEGEEEAPSSARPGDSLRTRRGQLLGMGTRGLPGTYRSEWVQFTHRHSRREPLAQVRQDLNPGPCSKAPGSRL